MRKIYLLAPLLFFSMYGFSQTASAGDRSTTVSGLFSFPELYQYGVTLEFSKNYSFKFEDRFKYKGFKSFVLNLAYTEMDYDAGPFDITGTGFTIDAGHKNYFAPRNAGFYYANYLSYGNIKYDENTSIGKFDGTYSYFSFFSPEVGFKFKFGRFSVDPFAGIMWKLEIKGKGDVDNRNVDEWIPRFGVKAGFEF